jgi:hypothetical protein
MAITHEPLNLGRGSSLQWSIMGLPTSFIWIVVSFDEVFEYGDSAKFWGYVGTNSEPLCVEFCSFVQCHIFVNDLIYCQTMREKYADLLF